MKSLKLCNGWKVMLLACLAFLSGCDEKAPDISDAEFHAWVPGETKISAVIEAYPDFSKEYLMHTRLQQEADEQDKAKVTLVYHTRSGHYYLHFEGDVLVYKRKLT